MPDKINHLREKYIRRLEELTTVLTSRDDQRIDALVSELTTLRESSLHQELGKLTREIHDSIKSFAGDERIAELAQKDIPDARERLNFIVTKTDEAAHRTMTSAEEAASMVNVLNSRAQVIRDRWRQFQSRKLSKQAFIVLSEDLVRFLEAFENEAQSINGKMTEIMLAQDYQDITGQMIKQVVCMVQEVEEKLVRLVTISGIGIEQVDDRIAQGGEIAVGPQLPNAGKKLVVHSQGDVDELLANLGF